MGDNGTGKAVLGLALLAWVGYMAWPKVMRARQIASIPQASASTSSNALTSFAAVGLPEARPRASAFSASDVSFVAPTELSADERSSKLKQATVYLHAANFAAAGAAFAGLSASHPDDIAALQGLDAARRRLLEVDTGVGSDAASLRQTLWNDLLTDAEEAHADGRYEQANHFINWAVILMTQSAWPEAEEYRSSERFNAVGLLNTPKPQKSADGGNLTFDLPDSEAQPEAAE